MGNRWTCSSTSLSHHPLQYFCSFLLVHYQILAYYKSVERIRNGGHFGMLFTNVLFIFLARKMEIAKKKEKGQRYKIKQKENAKMKKDNQKEVESKLYSLWTEYGSLGEL